MRLLFIPPCSKPSLAKSLAGIALSSSLFWIGGCGSKDADKVTPLESEASDPSQVPPNIDPARGSGGTIRIDGEDEEKAKPPKEEKLSASALAGEISAMTRSWKAEKAAFQLDEQDALEGFISKLPTFKEDVKALYQDSEHEGRFVSSPFFSQNFELKEGADEILSLFLLVDEHGLEPEDYLVEDLDGILKVLQDAPKKNLDARNENEKALFALFDALKDQKKEASIPELEGRLLEAGFSDKDLPLIQGMKAQIAASAEQNEVLQKKLWELDVLLAHGVFRWVFDQRFALKAQPFFADRSIEAGIKRTRNEIQLFLSDLDWGEPEAILKRLGDAVPRFPDYEPTRKAYLRYMGYHKAHPEHIILPKAASRLRRGQNGDVVKLLQERLIQEEYLEGEADGLFGEALETALSLYQETHQMTPSGSMDEATRGSLNRSFLSRAEQLKLALMRYRESDLHQGQYRFGESEGQLDERGQPVSSVRAVINIPAMEARFYQGETLVRTHKVVVGNNASDRDVSTGKSGKLNQTRLFTAEMRTIVLNPVWNVPKRIKEQELDLLLMDEPDYYEKHNYKVIMNSDGTERVVQQPGDNNALGRVKFLFPNEYAIYMHDTPSKRLFQRDIRAFSHGCVRTENPLDLARWILVELNGTLTDEQFDEILKSKEEKHLLVRPRIPITIDYIVANIDTEGRPNFLSDLYGFDKAFSDGKVPYKRVPEHPRTVIF